MESVNEPVSKLSCQRHQPDFSKLFQNFELTIRLFFVRFKAIDSMSFSADFASCSIMIAEGFSDLNDVMPVNTGIS